MAKAKENKSKGYVKLYRSMFENNSLNPSASLLFIYFIAVANNKPKNVNGNDLEVGETMKSITQMADATNLNWRTVKKSLKTLADDNKIELRTVRVKGNDTYIVKVVNYKIYQFHAPDQEEVRRTERQDSSERPSSDEYSSDVKNFNLWGDGNKNDDW